MKYAFFYQLLWQLPNIIIIPFLIPFLDSASIVSISKIFVAAALLSLITDWGLSTLGAQKISSVKYSLDYVREIFVKGELIRFINYAIIIILIILLFAYKYISGDFDYNAIIPVILSSASQLIFPNWFIVGLNLYKDISKYLLIIRIFTLSILFFSVYKGVPIIYALDLYFSILILAFIKLRQDIVEKNNLEDIRCSSLKIIKISFNDYIPGFIIIMGGAVSYVTLNSGVFVADYLYGKKVASSYAVAERLIVMARALYFPFIQFSLVKLSEQKCNKKYIGGNYSEKLDHISLTNLLMSILFSIIVWILGELYFNIIYIDNLSLINFRVLIIGFAGLGISHHYITFNILGIGLYYIWVSFLTLSMASYLVALYLLNLSEPFLYLGVSYSVVFAEFFLIILGIFFFILRSYKSDRIQH